MFAIKRGILLLSVFIISSNNINAMLARLSPVIRPMVAARSFCKMGVSPFKQSMRTFASTSNSLSHNNFSSERALHSKIGFSPLASIKRYVTTPSSDYRSEHSSRDSFKSSRRFSWLRNLWSSIVATWKGSSEEDCEEDEDDLSAQECLEIIKKDPKEITDKEVRRISVVFESDLEYLEGSSEQCDITINLPYEMTQKHTISNSRFQSDFLSNKGGLYVLSKIIQTNERLEKPLLNILKKNIMESVESDKGSIWLRKLHLYNHYVDEKIFFENPIIRWLQNHISFGLDARGRSSFSFTLVKSNNDEGLHDEKLSSLKRLLTPTQRHLVYYAHKILRGKMGWNGCNFLDDYVRDDKLNHLMDQIIDGERKAIREGCYSFVHGQRSENYLIEDWFTKLWGLRRNKSVEGYLFPHVKSTDLSPEQLATEREYHKQVLDTGTPQSLENRCELRSRLLFLNYALFANSSYQGCCTARYILKNNNLGKRHCTMRDAFKHNGLEDYYEKYKEELNELERKFDTEKKYGNLLLVSVPKDKASEFVYPAIPGGGRKTVAIKERKPWWQRIISPSTYTSSISQVMDTLHTNPHAIDSDHIEFCLTLTGDKLTPESGVKIQALHAKDQATFATLQTESEVLFKKIRSDIGGIGQAKNLVKEQCKG